MTAEKIVEILAIIGSGTLLCLAALIISCLIDFVHDIIRKAKRKYKYKHKFDKLPTAKCYCKDCYYWHDGDCTHFRGWRTADNWFCWNAKLRNNIED